MVSKLLEHNRVYYCSNCRMKQYQPREHCNFCGATFSNWESVQIELYKIVKNNEMEEQQYESNIY